MVVKAGVIAYVGPESGASGFLEFGKTKLVDLGGRAVLPGFHDVHMHPLEVGSKVGKTCLVPNNTAPTDPAFTKPFLIDNCALGQVGMGNSGWVLGEAK